MRVPWLRPFTKGMGNSKHACGVGIIIMKSEKAIGDVQAQLLDVTTEELVAELERRAEAGRLEAAELIEAVKDVQPNDKYKHLVEGKW